MIAKRYRLSEREVKRVLGRWKPFFSWIFVASALQNRENRIRTGIILSGKHVQTAIDRNFFRRRFYDAVACVRDARSIDFILRAKKGAKLVRRSPESVAEFDKHLATILQNLLADASL